MVSVSLTFEFVSILISLGSITAVGYFVFNKLTTGVTHPDASLRILLALFSFGAALGLGSFVWTIAFFAGLSFWVLPAISLVCLVTAFFTKRKKNVPALYKNKLKIQPLVVVSVFAIFYLIYQGLYSFQNPYGYGDGWVTWHYRARMMFALIESPFDAFRDTLYWLDDQRIWSHPDYPLLLPSWVAFSWQVADGHSFLFSFLIYLLLNACLVLMLFFFILRKKGSFSAMLCAGLLFATPFFQFHTYTHYSDVPLAFFMLSSVCMLLLIIEGVTIDKDSTWPLVTLGALVGGAVWCKNEGLLFAFIFMSILVVLIFLKRLPIRSLTYFGFSFFLFLGLVGFLKYFVAPTNDIVGSVSSNTLSKLFSPKRWLKVFEGLKAYTPNFGVWLFKPWLLILLYMGLFWPKHGNRFALIPLCIFVAMFCAYVILYSITPLSIQWHMQTSWDRLLLQLWPLFLLTLFYFLDSPSEAFQKVAARLNVFGRKKI